MFSVSSKMIFFVLFASFICISSSADSCGTIQNQEVTAAQQEEIVNYHNYLRNLIATGQVPDQPRGKNFKTMKWDTYLGEEGQKIANTCVFEHVKVDDDRFYVGQNLYGFYTTASTAPANWTSAIDAWFSEHKNFVYPDISNGVTGHYTQVVWADSEYIGCGFISHRDTSPDENGYYWLNNFYVCNYGPGGNWAGEAPYELA